MALFVVGCTSPVSDSKQDTVNNIDSSANTNANLTSLTVSAGTLTPTFSAATLSYSVDVPNGVTSITVTGTAAISDTDIEILGKWHMGTRNQDITFTNTTIVFNEGDAEGLTGDIISYDNEINQLLMRWTYHPAYTGRYQKWVWVGDPVTSLNIAGEYDTPEAALNDTTVKYTDTIAPVGDETVFGLWTRTPDNTEYQLLLNEDLTFSCNFGIGTATGTFTLTESEIWFLDIGAEESAVGRYSFELTPDQIVMTCISDNSTGRRPVVEGTWHR